MFHPSILPVISNEEIKKVRRFTLTSGYDPTNTRFVRVKDSYSVQADPALVRKTDESGEVFFEPHHVKYEGFLYRCHPGYVIATLKKGWHGWSEVVELDRSWVVFNPWEDKRVEFILDEEYNFVVEVTSMKTGETLYLDREVKDLGVWTVLNGSQRRVRGPVFKGVKTLLRRLRKLDQNQYPFHYGGYSFDRSLRSYYDLGEINFLEKPLSLEEIFLTMNKGFNIKNLGEVDVYYTNRLTEFSTLLVVTEEVFFKAGVSLVDYGSSLNLSEVLGFLTVKPIESAKPVSELPKLKEKLTKERLRVAAVFPND